ncbi:hypothetical protein ACJMK2_018424 [Sinanodonta woodiana]|uniref:Uncharacterized protein n=1 Tax=Sinanodonta woodiana TaxID=1069815 RepID=A0ABD3UH97_SINWO
MEMYRSIGTHPMSRDVELHSWYDWCLVDSLICLHFFQYMNFSKQRKKRHKQVAMDNMIHVIRTEPSICHRDTAFNILGYSFMQENKPINAFICFAQSLKICPHHNAAKLYLGIMHRRVIGSQRRPLPY